MPKEGEISLEQLYKMLHVSKRKTSRAAQMKKISKNLSKAKSRKALCNKDFRDFMFALKLREKCEKSGEKQLKIMKAKKRKTSKT